MSELLILSLINQGVNYGLSIVEQSNGLVKKGTIYTSLKRFEELGFLTKNEEIIEIKTKWKEKKTQQVQTYALTKEGKTILRFNRKMFKQMSDLIG